VATQEIIAYEAIRECENNTHLIPWLGAPDPEDGSHTAEWYACERQFYATQKGRTVTSEIAEANAQYTREELTARNVYWTERKAAEKSKDSERDRISDGGHDAYMRWFGQIAGEAAGTVMTPLRHLTDQGAKLERMCPGILARYNLRATVPGH
jgi:hypothetical protein